MAMVRNVTSRLKSFILTALLDIVVLAGSLVVVIGFMVGADSHLSSGVQQVEDYALDLC
jgi:hypothetical protein